MLLSSVAIGQLWAKIYDPTNGILNKFLSALGMHNTPAWLGDSKMALFALMIPIVWQYAGFYILIYYAALMDVSEEIIEAARIDGASQWRIALSVKFPLIMNVVKVTIVLALVGSLKYFDLIYIMTGGGPNGATEVMASYMYKTAFQDFNFGYASAIAFFFLIICLIVTYITRRITRADEDIY
jgi:raffinose/stachyose/melibiose transport system permease protein